LLTSRRANLQCEAIQIPCKIDRGPASNNRERRESPVATTYGLRMAEAAGGIPVIVGGVGRCSRYRKIYRTLGVAGQKDHRSGKVFMEDASLQQPKDMAVCYNDVGKDCPTGEETRLGGTGN